MDPTIKFGLLITNYKSIDMNGEIYEYVAVYVDDLAFALKDPQTFVDAHKSKHSYKIKM